MILDKLKRIWCRINHNALMQPVCNKAICRICLTEWEVFKWEKKDAPKAKVPVPSVPPVQTACVHEAIAD